MTRVMTRVMTRMTRQLGVHRGRDTNIARVAHREKEHDVTGSVLVVTSNFPRWQGDSVTPFVLHLVQGLQSVGWRVGVLAPHAEGAASHEIIDGVRVDRFRYMWPSSQETVCYGGGALVNLRQNRRNVAKLPALIAAEWLATARHARRDYDLINSHWILPQGLVAGFMPRRIPNVITAHGGDVFGLQGRALAGAKRVALRRADTVTCNSSVTENAVRRIAPGISTKRIPMGIDVSRVPNPDLVSALRARYRRADGPLLVFVGRLVEEKGFADFLAALARVAILRPDATGLVVGDGQDRANAEQLAVDLGIGERVHFTGWVESAEVPSYIAAGDVFLAPSRRGPDGWIEAQGLSVVEAMALGVPVVASACGGIVDTVEHGVSGALVPERAPEAIAAAVERYLTDEGLRNRVAVNGRRVARDRFSLEATAAAFDSLFREVLTRRGVQSASGRRRQITTP
jgi:phosphatidylinositol alpha-1,6-mannosyltransferase